MFVAPDSAENVFKKLAWTAGLIGSSKCANRSTMCCENDATTTTDGNGVLPPKQNHRPWPKFQNLNEEELPSALKSKKHL